MNALYLTLFVSLGLAVMGVLMFLQSVARRDHDHTERLALLPLEDDTGAPPASDPVNAPSTPDEGLDDPCSK